MIGPRSLQGGRAANYEERRQARGGSVRTQAPDLSARGAVQLEAAILDFAQRKGCCDFEGALEEILTSHIELETMMQLLPKGTSTRWENPIRGPSVRKSSNFNGICCAEARARHSRGAALQPRSFKSYALLPPRPSSLLPTSRPAPQPHLSITSPPWPSDGIRSAHAVERTYAEP